MNPIHPKDQYTAEFYGRQIRNQRTFFVGFSDELEKAWAPLNSQISGPEDLERLRGHHGFIDIVWVGRFQELGIFPDVYCYIANMRSCGCIRSEMFILP